MTDVLAIGGIIAFLAVFMGVGVWLQLHFARRTVDRDLNPASLAKLDPATRQKFVAEILEKPGGKELLAKMGWDQLDQDTSTKPQ